MHQTVWRPLDRDRQEAWRIITVIRLKKKKKKKSMIRFLLITFPTPLQATYFSGATAHAGSGRPHPPTPKLPLVVHTTTHTSQSIFSIFGALGTQPLGHSDV